MAIRGVQPVAAQDQVTDYKPARQGGGKAGQMVGGFLGGIAGIPGGPAGVMAGVATGSSLGGVVGNAISPEKAASTAIERRLQSAGPQVQSSPQTERLKQSVLALHQAPPDIKAEYAAPLVKAYMVSAAKDYA